MITQTSGSPQHGATTGRHGERRVDLDWLRTLLVLGIIPYHALLYFAVASGSIIKPAISDPRLPLVFSALEGWGIPVIFLLAGAASGFALERRPPGTYVKERLLRLLAPLPLVALAFAPLRAYYLFLNNPRLISVSPVPISDPERLRGIGPFFWQYWTILFTTGTPIISRNPLAHLWFVPRLLAVSLICAPLLLFLRDRWPRWLDRLAAAHVPPAALLLGGGLLPAALVVALQPGWLNRLTTFFPLSDDWTVFFLDLTMFVFGYALYSSARLRDAARDMAYLTLALAVVSWVVVFAVMFSGHAPAYDYSLASILFTLTRVFAMWLLTLAAIGLAARYLSVSPSWQPYLTTATFPVYVLHLPLLIAATYYLQWLPAPWYLRLALAIAVTVASAFALYEYVVRRTPGLRFLFGVKAAGG